MGSVTAHRARVLRCPPEVQAVLPAGLGQGAAPQQATPQVAAAGGPCSQAALAVLPCPCVPCVFGSAGPELSLWFWASALFGGQGA